MKAVVALLLLAAPFAQSTELTFPKDGWVSWQVAAIDSAPNWCCYNSAHDPRLTGCKLDGNNHGFSTREREDFTDTVTVYAKFASGKLDKLRALAASCPVEANTAIQSLGDVASDDSARWLAKQAAPTNMGEQALAALAIHGGDFARDSLTNFARNDSNVEMRKRSVFWLALSRGAEGAEVASKLMFDDKDPEVRTHAAFALSQSRAPGRAADLIRQGNTDKVPDVRAQAWFWLAQTGAPGAEQAIQAAIRKESSDDVRERAVFALSQLPDDRGTKALISIAEDKALMREQRKRAVFWLSQSESNSAQAYLEKVLATNAR